MNITVGYTQVSCLNEKGEAILGEYYDAYVLDNTAYDITSFISVLTGMGYVYGQHYNMILTKYMKYNNSSGKYEETLIPVLTDHTKVPFFSLYPKVLINGGEYFETSLRGAYDFYKEYVDTILEYPTEITISKSIYENNKSFKLILKEEEKKEKYRLEREKSRKAAEEKKRLKEKAPKTNTVVEEPPKAEEQPKVEEPPKSEEPPKVEEMKPEEEEFKEEVSVEELGLELNEEVQEENIENTEEEEEEIVESSSQMNDDILLESDFEFKDLMLTDTSIEDIILNKNEIAKGNTDMFYPRVKTSKDIKYVKDSDELIEIYQNVKDRKPIFSLSQEVLKNISEHFGDNEKYPLKVIFDAYLFEEIEAMLHIEIMDKSPNNLYEGMFKHVYLYKKYMEITGEIDPGDFQVLSVMRHISLSSLSQSAVVISQEEGSDSDNYDVDKDVYFILENDPINETNDGLKEYLTSAILRAKLFDKDDNPVSSEDKISEICKRAYRNEIFRIEKDEFLTLVGIPYLDIILKSNQVDLMVSGISLSPNVIGKLYNIYQRNIREFYEGIMGTQDKPTGKELSVGIDYNKILKEMQESKDFSSVYGITQYKPITDVFDMNLKIDFVVIPSVNGKRLSAPIGIVATNTNAININKNKVFLPFFGDYLESLDKLGITLNADLTCGNNPKLKTFTVFPKDMVRMTKDFGTKILEVGEINSLDGLERALKRTKNLEGLTIPGFVLNKSESVERIYRVFGLFTVR